ncbi:hypothetical protein Tco_0529774 [Tanacetum coccineum]
MTADVVLVYCGGRVLGRFGGWFAGRHLFWIWEGKRDIMVINVGVGEGRVVFEEREFVAGMLTRSWVVAEGGLDRKGWAGRDAREAEQVRGGLTGNISGFAWQWGDDLLGCVVDGTWWVREILGRAGRGGTEVEGLMVYVYLCGYNWLGDLGRVLGLGGGLRGSYGVYWEIIDSVDRVGKMRVWKIKSERGGKLIVWGWIFSRIVEFG